LEAAARHVPDVIVADISMPSLNGLDALDQLRKNGCRAKVVFLTMHNDSTYAKRAMQSGASGFVLKHSAPEELLVAIREALVGRTYVAKSVAETLPNTSGVHQNSSDADEPVLTPRQRDVIQLVAEGKTAKEIGAILHISMRTAENHKARIMRLLGASTTAELIRFAMRHGIISSD
jgi:DNA-binding NarL/FixJ family response regulator